VSKSLRELHTQVLPQKSEKMENPNQPSSPTKEERSGLIKTLESLGRTKGSSATPAPPESPLSSPPPNLDFQARPNTMNTMGSMGSFSAPSGTSTARQPSNNDKTPTLNRSFGARSVNQSQNLGSATHTRYASSSAASIQSPADHFHGIGNFSGSGSFKAGPSQDATSNSYSGMSPGGNRLNLPTIQKDVSLLFRMRLQLTDLCVDPKYYWRTSRSIASNKA
jgi:hypothetical protein